MVKNDIDQLGGIQEKATSSGSNNENARNGSEGDNKSTKHNIPTSSSSSSSSRLYVNNTTSGEFSVSSSFNSDTVQLAHHQPGPGPGYVPQLQPETQSKQTAVAQPFQGGTLFTQTPRPPSRNNKDSPPPYDQALLNQQNYNAQQMNIVSSFPGSLSNNGSTNGLLKQQVQAASDVVQTLSQLTATSLPISSRNQPMKVSYGMTPSPPLPRTTNVTIPHGDYHIASFTKPVPTSSYVSSLSTDIDNLPFQLPQMNDPGNKSSPPLPPMSAIPSSSTSSSTSSIVEQSSSFTYTFLRGILTSIDSKDPVVANAWLETLLDAIDLLPADVIRREIVVLAVKKGQPSQTSSDRKSSCRLLGKIATKLDEQLVRQEVLPTTLSLCQDIDAEVRYCMCRHLALVCCGIGLEATKSTILPQIVELCDDKNSDVRLAAIETVVQLLGLLDDHTCTQVIIPLMIKTCEQAKQLEDETLVNIAHYLGRLCHGLTKNLNTEQKRWFVNFYQYLAKLSLDGDNDKKPLHLDVNSEEEQNKESRILENSSIKHDISSPTTDSNHPLVRNTTTSASPMPDLVSMLESNTTNLKSEIYSRCRYECAYNFPAMVLFAEAKAFSEVMYPVFANLSSDTRSTVRCTIASSLHELAKIIGTNFDLTKNQIVNLFADASIEVLEHMVANMVHIIDALARSGTVLQFGQGGQFSTDISNALVRSIR